MEKLVIVGGGVAGLSCLNALLDKGISPLLIEGGQIGSPKICGEYLAPVVLKQLENWEIGPIELINKIHFQTNKKKLAIELPLPAGAFSRSEAELQLARRAKNKGANIQESAFIDKVVPATEQQPFVFYFKDGSVIEAEFAIFATGRFSQGHSAGVSYCGLKTHFPQVLRANTLTMFSTNNTYFGVVPINQYESNLACLIKGNLDKHFIKNYFFQQIESEPYLKELFSNIDFDKLTWLEANNAYFGAKNIPKWPKSFWIGDALASFYPAIGYGFAHSIISANLAAEFYYKNNFKSYYKNISTESKYKIIFGKLLHECLMRPNLGSAGLSIANYYPSLVKMTLSKLGYER